MISPITGEVRFSDGLHICTHLPLPQVDTPGAFAEPFRAVRGWIRHFLKAHPSEHGSFEVQALSDRDGYIKTIAVSHVHPFYEPSTPDDAERHTFHEGIVTSDLLGKRDFSWGEIHFRLDIHIRDWLVIVYSDELPDSISPSRLPDFLY